MSVIINILILLVVISILTFVHELGHFIAARLVKAKVLEFSVGFGPKIYSKKRKGTDFSIRVLPFGG
jgi:regulator of sigma E protease